MQKRNKIFFVEIFLCTVSCVVLGCAETSPRIETMHAPIPENAPPPVVPPSNTAKSSVSTSETTAPKKVALILGPGSFKAFAHLGVLKELKKANVPVDAVVGVEWGALVGALFAAHGQVHEAEWKLYKLERVDLNSTGFFSRRREARSTKTMSPFLAENLGNRDVNQSTVPFFCPSLSLSRGVESVLRSGPVDKMVEACLASPPLLEPQGDTVADLFGIEEAIKVLRGGGYNVIVLVNVLGDGNLFDKIDLSEDYAAAVLWDEARREVWKAKSMVTDVIDVPTQGLGLSDFESRKVLVTAGEAAGERAAKVLLSKYGF